LILLKIRLTKEAIARYIREQSEER
jgi:hypothetical protein